MAEAGLEPARPFGHKPLKLARLPLRHSANKIMNHVFKAATQDEVRKRIFACVDCNYFLDNLGGIQSVCSKFYPSISIQLTDPNSSVPKWCPLKDGGHGRT